MEKHSEALIIGCGAIMAYSGKKGLSRIIRATGYSWQGLRAAYRYEEAFRQEIWLCLVMIPLGLYLGDGGVEKALLVGSLLLLPLIDLLAGAQVPGDHHPPAAIRLNKQHRQFGIAVGVVVLDRDHDALRRTRPGRGHV